MPSSTATVKINGRTNRRTSSTIYSILLSLSLLAMGCAVRNQSPATEPWGAQADASIKDCRARFLLKIDSPREKHRVEAGLHMKLQGQNSELQMSFLSPFRTVAARLSLSRDKQAWTDDHGEHALSEQPVFHRWFQPNWWGEVAFLMGIVTPKSKAFVKTNESQRPLLYTHGTRKITCVYDSGPYPSNCELSDQELNLTFNFTFIECVNNL